MQIVGPPKSEIWNSVAADDVQRAKPLGPMAQTLQGPMADGFMRLDYQSLVLRVSLAIAMLQQFSTGDDVK